MSTFVNRRAATHALDAGQARRRPFARDTGFPGHSPASPGFLRAIHARKSPGFPRSRGRPPAFPGFSTRRRPALLFTHALARANSAAAAKV